MQTILTPEQSRLLDEYMIDEQGIPGIVLMEHAAMAVAREACRLMPSGGIVGILCGGGNNGGDGLSVLRQLAMRGVEAWAALLAPPDALGGDALLQYRMARNCGLTIIAAETEAEVNALPFARADVLVDALFGTGLCREISGRYLSAVRFMNESDAPVVAVDIPSGVHGENGAVMGEAVSASVTVAFQHKKPGHLLLPGRSFTGELRVAPIGVVATGVVAAGEFHKRMQHAMEEWEDADVAALLPPRPLGSHKGDNGRALLCAGSERYTGAATLCARAALRAGCGLLYTAMPRDISPTFRCEASIRQPVGETGEWDAAAAAEAAEALAGKDAAAIGPGMGSGQGVAQLLERALKAKLPLVIDADGLNALSRERELLALLHENAILTPHPGEMSRLIDGDTPRIAADPVRHARQYAAQWGCTVLLKGATSVIASGERTCLNSRGNPGLAKGGSGDVLTGILLGLLAQGAPPYEAACAGAYLLGESAEKAVALLGTRALLPTDIIDALMKE